VRGILFLYQVHHARKLNIPDMTATGNPRIRDSLKPGYIVDIVRKEDQRSGKKTRGVIEEILTNSPTHPHGIKVRLGDRQVGRVAAIIETSPSTPVPCGKTQPQSITAPESSLK
jgi:uncharacterized repeat protein (TIGR03833 family)